MSATVDIATLGLEVRSDGVVVASDRLKKLQQEGSEAESAAGKLSKAFDSLTNILKAAAAALGLWKLADFIKDVTLMAARYETLGVSMTVVGNNAGYTSKQMDEFQAKLEKTGIAAMESRQTLIQMAQAHIDLKKSTELARIAQDAAVIGNINSSEAFERMISGIQRGETEVLRTIGLNVNFEQAYQKLAMTLGKTAEQLSENEKVQARTNAVMAKGVDIAGTYEAAMGTAGKQLNSMKRYIDNLKISVGEVFQDVLIMAVEKFTDQLKSANKEAQDLKEKGQLKEWGRDLVKTFAMVADGINLIMNTVATFTGATIAGVMQVYKIGEAAWNLAKGNIGGASQSIADFNAYGSGFVEDMQKRWSQKSFSTAAEDMYAKRDANAASDAAKMAELEQRRIAAGEARRKEAEATEKARQAEIGYLANLKNSLDLTKDYTSVMNEFAKTKLEFADQRFGDSLKQQVDLLKESRVTVQSLMDPMKQYAQIVKETFDTRETMGGNQQTYILDLIKHFNESVKSTNSKEAKAARVELLNAYKDSAIAIIGVEQSRYKALLDGERKYANEVLSLIQAKRLELTALQDDITNFNRKRNERINPGVAANLDQYQLYFATIEKLRKSEAEAMNLVDSQKKIDALKEIRAGYDALDNAIIVDGVEIIQQFEVRQRSQIEINRLNQIMTDTIIQQKAELEMMYAQSLSQMDIYQQKLVQLDDLLSKARTIKVDFSVDTSELIRAMDQIRNLTLSPVQQAPAVSSAVNQWWANTVKDIYTPSQPSIPSVSYVGSNANGWSNGNVSGGVTINGGINVTAPNVNTFDTAGAEAMARSIQPSLNEQSYRFSMISGGGLSSYTRLYE